MVQAHPTTEKNNHRMDDLKQIRGIGPAMEHRLNEAGIFTFAQIADLSNEELTALFSDMPGFSAERITEKDWGNQARLLMEKKTTSNRSGSNNTNGEYSAIFSVDLRLDNQNRVRRTHILHVQSQKENSWAGWNQDQLASFIRENANIREAAEPRPATKSSPKNKKQTGAQEIHGDVHISEVEIQSKSSKDAQQYVSVNEPFAVGLILDLSNTSIAPKTSLQYQTEVHVKNLANGNHQKIGESKGALESRNLSPIMVNCDPLPHGIYRLDVCIILAQNLESLNSKSQLMAMTEGKVFQVG
jgi:hypothetical protein